MERRVEGAFRKTIMKRYLSLLPAALFLYAYPTIDATVDSKDNEVKLSIDFEGRCDGVGELDDPVLGKTTWTKSDASGDCEVKMDWSGDIIDVLQIRDDIDAEAKLSGLEVTRLRVLLKNVRVLDSMGADVTPQDINMFSADTMLNGEAFYSLSGDDFQAALGDTGFERIFEEPDPLLDKLSQSLRDREAAPATAHVEIRTDAIDPLQPNNPHTLVFIHDFEVTVAGKFKL
jgi:hypothetical protein